jgi:hypothetical protein
MLKYFRMNFTKRLFELNFLHSKFKICLGAAQKHSEGRGLKTPAIKRQKPALNPTQPQFDRYQRPFTWVLSGRSVKLTNHLHLIWHLEWIDL